MATRSEMDNEMAIRFRRMFGDRHRKVYAIVVCLICDKGVGLANRLVCRQGKLVADEHHIKLGITICHACGLRTSFGRIYSRTDHTRIMNGSAYKRLNELANRTRSTIEILNDMVYLKAIVTDITCEIFSVTWTNITNTGFNVRACVPSDMIRS